MKRLLLACLLLAGCVSVPSNPAFFAHRGDDIDHVEHTFSSYDAAIAKGAHYIEQDLVLSKDGTLYVSHDMDAKRLTGDPAKYADMTDEQINRLRTANGEPIHTLKQVFERYGDEVWYVPELRDEPGQLEKFIKLVKEAHVEDRVITQVWSLAYAKGLKDAFPNMPVQYFVNSPLDLMEGANSRYVDILCFNRKMMTPVIVNVCHQARKQACFWTLDTADEIKKAQNIGADIYFTDDTALGVEMEKTEAEP